MRQARGLRIGIVGCGGISREHVRAYRAAGARIALVYDVHRPAAQTLAREVGAEVADSLKAMAKPGVLDAVSICTPPAFHLENCLPFVKARIPVLCEKPLEVNLPRARALAAAVHKHRPLFMTAYCHRFHPPILEAKKLIERGAIGKPLVFRNMFAGRFVLKGNHRANPRLSGGGCVADNAAHAVDLFRFLMGEVVSVQAQTAHLAQKEAAEDFGLVVLRGRKGCVGDIICSYSLPTATNFVEVLGTRGSVAVSYWIPGRPDVAWRAEGGKGERAVDVRRRPDRFTGEVRHFLDCVRTGHKPRVSAGDGLASAKIIAAAYASARSGRLIRIRWRNPHDHKAPRVR